MWISKRLRRIALNIKVNKEGGQFFSSTLRKYYLSEYNINIGYGSYGGCFHKGNIPSGTQFGNYCSIGQGVKIFRANHPLNAFTTHPIFYNPVVGYVDKDILDRPMLTIGNDVWIGDNVIVLPGCRTIGNGVVVGAGSIMTKDVPPYSIVAGNPARVIRMRFPLKVIRQLEASKWWELKKEELIKNKKNLDNIVNEK